MNRSMHCSKRWQRALLAGAVSILCMEAGPAHAQTAEELNAARVVFREGIALSAAQDWAGALAKFKQVAEVKMTAQVAFNIAECEEHLGQLVSALGNYRLAASEAAKTKAKDVASQVPPRIANLEERVPKLTIEVSGDLATASVQLDGLELGPAQLGTPIPIDPGAHVVVAKRDGEQVALQTVSLAEKESKSVKLEAAEAKPEVVAPPAVTSEPAPATPPTDSGGYGSTPGIVATAVGGVSIVAGVVFLGLRGSALSDLDEMCGGDDTCPPSAESTSDKGKLYTGLAEVTMVVGVAGVATGVVLLLTSKKSPPAETKASASLRFVGAAPGADGGASLVGRF